MPPGSYRSDDIPYTPTLQEYYDNLVARIKLVNDLYELTMEYEFFPKELPDELLDAEGNVSQTVSVLHGQSKSLKYNLNKIKKLIDLSAFK